MSKKTQALSLSSLPAVVEKFERRQDRLENPDGAFDKKGRWYPSKDERQECCSSIRYPSRAWPYSYMVHCRTLQHIQHLLGVAKEQWIRRARSKKVAAALAARTA
jgi:hypothetical protein